MTEWMLDTFKYSIIVAAFTGAVGLAGFTIILIVGIFASSVWFLVGVPVGIFVTVAAFRGAVKLVNMWTSGF